MSERHRRISLGDSFSNIPAYKLFFRLPPSTLRHFFSSSPHLLIPSSIFFLILTLQSHASPTITALFPPGGKVGSSVEVSIYGGDLNQATQLLVDGKGVSGELIVEKAEIDTTAKGLFESKCTLCHELRSPSNRSKTPAQWEATVERMIQEKNAPITPDEKDKIVSYLKSAARSSGLTAKLNISPEATVGAREIRILTAKGGSTSWPFEVSLQEEIMDVEPNNSVKEAMMVTLPVTVNGQIGSEGDVDHFSFLAKANQRLVFEVKAYRLNPASQAFFNPVIYLLDQTGKELTRNSGFYSLDPLIDFVVPKDGIYVIRIRDLLYRGSPACVYRLTMGVSQHQEYVEAVEADGAAVQSMQKAQTIELPSNVNGRISSPGEVDFYKFTVTTAEALGEWWVIQPFDNPNESGLDIVYPPEEEVDFQKKYPGKGGRLIGWYKATGSGNNVFSNVPEDDVIGYALTYIESDCEKDVILSLGTDDGVKVWLNDKLIWVNHVHRGIRPGDDVIPLPLKEGKNKLLLKIDNGYGPWGFIASFGGYAFEVLAERLGSPLSPALTLLDPNGVALANSAGAEGSREPRINYSFSRPGGYFLRVEDVAGNGGEGYIYRLHAFPATADFELTVTPDNPNIGRGGTVMLTVTATRRIGLSSEIELEVKGLPPGVVASPAVIPTDMNQGLITLTALAEAPIEHQLIEVLGKAKGADGKMIYRKAAPLEIYRVNNQPRTIRRSQLVVSVTETSDFALDIIPQQLVISPGQKSELRVTVERRNGFDRDIALTLEGLPNGVRTPGAVILRKNQAEATIVLEPTIVASGITARSNIFAGRPMDASPYNIVVNGRAGDTVNSAPAVKLSIDSN